MGKNIVICLDGTGNQFKEHNSNVVKLFRVLERDPHRQVAYYDPGVGTLGDPTLKTPVGKKISKALGLAFGSGLLTNVEEAYSYLMEHYADGDQIFLFGFSRGSYTARVLAGFIHHCGLLEQGCQNLIPYALKLYTKANRKQLTDTDWKTAATFRKTYGRAITRADGKKSSRCPVAFLGLWDSVSTFGWVFDPIFLPHTSNNKGVQTVRHALAIDERRLFFRQLQWGTAHRDQQDVKEVWFAGVHSDVGGGYPEEESALAKIALEWMVREAEPFGLVVDQHAFDRYVLGENSDYTAPSALGEIHKSLKGLWWPVELLPKKTWDSVQERKILRRPSPNKPRTIPEEPRPVVHQSVIERMEQTEYAPKNLPPIEKLRESFDVEPSPEPAT